MEDMNKESQSSQGNLTNEQADKLKSFQDRQLSFGEKAVGLTFNPGGKVEVNNIKRHYADIIDYLNDLREGKITGTKPEGEVQAQLTLAIRNTQTAQMWAVKAVTWN